jgi:hypothetical protein
MSVFLERFVIPLTLVVALLVVTNPIGLKPGSRFIIGGIVVLVAYFSSVSIHRHKSKTQATKSTDRSKNQPQREERDFVSVTPGVLFELYTKHTHLEAEALFKAFKGKWIRVSGQVIQVAKPTAAFINTAPFTYVYLQRTGDQPEMRLSFADDRWRGRVQVLQRGDTVTAVGTVEMVFSGSVLRLDRCEMVDGGASPQAAATKKEQKELPASANSKR